MHGGKSVHVCPSVYTIHVRLSVEKWLCTLANYNKLYLDMGWIPAVLYEVDSSSAGNREGAGRTVCPPSATADCVWG